MGKEYNSGKAKKWAIFLGIIVLVAIVVVVIVMAIPPNTYNAVQTLKRSAETSYLSVNSEKADFDKFKNKISASVVNAYAQEVYDYEDIAFAIDIILDYHNDYLVFAENNKNLKSNYKDIKEGLQDAKESQKALVSLVKKTNELSDESSTYLQGAMVDYRNEFVNYLSHSKRAIQGLENAYTGSLGSVSVNNPAAQTILNIINDYMTVISENFASLAKTDIKGANISSYSAKYQELGLKSKVELFVKFVEKNLGGDDITDYYFNNSVAEKYQLINKYFSLYNQKDTVELVSSIANVGGNSKITKTFTGITDSEGAYAAICKFVEGGV